MIWKIQITSFVDIIFRVEITFFDSSPLFILMKAVENEFFSCNLADRFIYTSFSEDFKKIISLCKKEKEK